MSKRQYRRRGGDSDDDSEVPAENEAEVHDEQSEE